MHRNIFPKELNLTILAEQQVVNQEWGNCTKFAGIWNNFQTRKKSDQTHPPIHPTKYTNNLQGSFTVFIFVYR